MAIDFFSSIDLNKNELQNAVITNATSDPANGVEGQIYYNSDDNQLKVHNGSSFVNISGDISGVTAGNGLSGGGTTGGVTLTLDISDSSLTTATSIAQADLLAFSDEDASNDPTKNITFSNLEDTIFGNVSGDITIAAGGAATIANGAVTNAMLSGSIAVGKLAASAITLSDGSQNSDLTLGDTLTITGTSPIGFAKESDDTFVITASDASTSAKGVAQFASADFSVSSGEVTIKSGGVSNAQLAGSIANSKLVNDGITIGSTDTSLGDTITAIVGLTDLDLTSGNKTIFDGVGSNTLTMGASGTTITIPGNLVVSGTQTIQNETVQIVENNTILFEGTTDDGNEIKLTGGDPTADRTVALPDASGTIALTDDITGTNSGTNTGDVTLAGSLDYLTISNQVITRNAIVLTTDVSGTLPIANGGTGATSASAAFTALKQAASTSATGVVELADATEIENGSGSGKVVDASGLGARSVISTISASSVNAATNKRAIINHSLNTLDVIVQLHDTDTDGTVYAQVTRTSDGGSTQSADHITVDFGRDIENDVKCIIMSAKGGTSKTPTYA